MKKSAFVILLCCIVLSAFAGCGNQTAAQAQTTAIGNPWSDWDTMEEAEAAIGFSFDLSEVIDNSYHAVRFRTLNKDLMEVVYRDEDYEVCVRKQKGERQDISGDYNQYETRTETNQNEATITSYSNANNPAVKLLISYKGYSWSLVASNGFREGSCEDFVREILEQKLQKHPLPLGGGCFL